MEHRQRPEIAWQARARPVLRRDQRLRGGAFLRMRQPRGKIHCRPALTGAVRLGHLLEMMAHDPLAPEEKVAALRTSLAEHNQRSEYLQCATMGALVRENLATLRHVVTEHADPATAPGALH